MRSKSLTTRAHQHDSVKLLKQGVYEGFRGRTDPMNYQAPESSVPWIVLLGAKSLARESSADARSG